MMNRTRGARGWWRALVILTAVVAACLPLSGVGAAEQAPGTGKPPAGTGINTAAAFANPRCEKQYGLTRDRLLINSSHTHSGPTTGDFAPRTGFEAQTEVVRRYTGALIDKAVETALVEVSPQWLTDLTTRF